MTPTKTASAASNRLSESIGVEASLEDAGGEEDPLPEDDAPPPQAGAPQPHKNERGRANVHSNISASRRSSLLQRPWRPQERGSEQPCRHPSIAPIAPKSNGRTSEAMKLLEKYLELALPRSIVKTQTSAFRI